MNDLFAHARTYPHLHPHAFISVSVDLLVTLVFWGTVMTALWYGARIVLQHFKKRSKTSWRR